MGGSKAIGWLGALDASFEAAIAREEEVAAADLAFSLRQDVDARQAVARSGAGWMLVLADAAASRVDELGADYVRSGATVVPMPRAVLRSGPGPAPVLTEGSLLELLGSECRAGIEVTVTTDQGDASGRLVRVAKDHVAVRNGETETIVGLAAIGAVRLGRGADYSASRGFSG